VSIRVSLVHWWSYYNGISSNGLSGGAGGGGVPVAGGRAGGGGVAPGVKSRWTEGVGLGPGSPRYLLVYLFAAIILARRILRSAGFADGGI